MPNRERLRTAGPVALSGGAFATGLRYRDLLNNEVVGAYQPINSLGWGTVAEFSTAEAFGDIKQMRLMIMASSALFLLLILLAALLVTRRVTRPLRHLMEGAQAIGNGDLDYKIQISNRDEIGMLAASFHQMARDLQESQTRMIEAERVATLQNFIQSKLEQLQQLSEMGLNITTQTSLPELMESTPALIRQLTEVDLAVLLVLEEESAGLDISTLIPALIQCEQQYSKRMPSEPPSTPRRDGSPG